MGGSVAEDRSATQASTRRKSKIIEPPAADKSTSADVPPSLAAEIAPPEPDPAAEIAPPKPDKRGADTRVGRTEPITSAKLAADTTMLQLSADEVRLLRHWRQLHPHGRRATLQYIGSLLVDD